MKVESIVGCIATGELAHWSGMLKEWIDVVGEYGKKTGDKCYIHSERTNVGMLALAAARSGGLALEEFPWIKTGKVQKDSKGRADLWVRCNSNGWTDEYIEAKHEWLSLTPRKPHADEAREMLKLATADAIKTRNRKHNMKCVALVFFPTYIHKKHEDNLPSIITNAVSDFRKQKAKLRDGAVAWCFPSEDRSYADKKGYLVPGVIMIAKVV